MTNKQHKHWLIYTGLWILTTLVSTMITASFDHSFSGNTTLTVFMLCLLAYIPLTIIMEWKTLNRRFKK